MAKAKQKGIPVTVEGTMWSRDVTIGREPGLAVSLQPLMEWTKVSIVTTPTKSVTPAALAQRDTYCDCDKLWKTIDQVKRNQLDPYFRAIRGKPYDGVRDYTVFMKLCLKKLPELEAFLHNQYVTYFTVCNREGQAWASRCITLFGFPYAKPDGSDVAVYQISGISWKIGAKKYEPYMISATLIPTIPSPGKVNVYLSGVMPGQCVTLAVYSYHS